MSSSDEDPFASDVQKANHSESGQPPMRFKRLNRAAADSDEELFNQVEGAEIAKKPQKKQFAKKLMKMFYDGDDEERPKKKKQPKVVKGKQTDPIKLKRLIKKVQSEEEVQPKQIPNGEAENINAEQLEGDKPKDEKRRHKKLKRKVSLSGDSESSVSDSVSLVPSSQPEDSEEYSCSGPRRHRQSKKERLRKKNEQKLKEWQQKFSVEEKDDDVQPVAEGQAYYTGMEFSYNFAAKRDKNAVKSRNKLFGEFQLAQPDEGEPEVVPSKDQIEQLDIKVKEVPTRSIMEFKFINKLNASRKARMDKPEVKSMPVVPVMPVTPAAQAAPSQMLRSTISETEQAEAQPPLQQSISQPLPPLQRSITETSIALPFSTEERSMRLSQQRKAKESLMKMVTSQHISHEANVEFELAVSIPYLARGRSSEVLNNTIYLKKLSSAHSSTKPEDQQPKPETTEVTPPAPTPKFRKGKGVSRTDFISSMVNEIKMRRSKFLSLDDIKDSFKKTDLEELELARQRIDKRKNDMMENIMGEDKEDSDYQPSANGSEEELEIDSQGKSAKVGDQDFKKLLGLDADEDEFEIEQKPQEEDAQEEGEEVDHQQHPEKQQGMVEKKEPTDEKVVEDKPTLPPTMDVEDNEEREQNTKKRSAEELEEALEEENADDVLADNESDEESEHAEEDSADRDFIKPDEEEESNHSSPKEQSRSEQKQAPSQDPTPNRLLLQDNSETMGMFKKLKNLAQKVLEKKQKKEAALRVVNEMLDEEAELGSDNESNDGRRKVINYEEEAQQYAGEDLDAELEDLIDRAPYLFNEQDEEEAYQRFLRDQRMQEKEQLMRVIRGEFRRSKKEFMEGMEEDEDGRQREERMEEMLRRYKQRDEAEEDMYYQSAPSEEEPSHQSHPVDPDEDEQHDLMELFDNGLQRRESLLSHKSNPMELSIFSEPKSNSINSSLGIGMKNRNSLLSIASDKSRLCSFEQAKLESGRTSKVSGLSKLYQKNVMASRSTVMLGLKRTASLRTEEK